MINALTTSAVLAPLTLAAAAMYIRDAKRRKTVREVCYEFIKNRLRAFILMLLALILGTAGIVFM